MALPVDYKKPCILQRDEKPRADACRVVGSLVEASLRRACRPKIGSIPCPLALQSAPLSPTVVLHGVLLEREMVSRKNSDVKTATQDAELALHVVRSGVSTLQQGP